MTMTVAERRMTIGSAIAGSLVLLLTSIDLVIGWPFAHRIGFDIVFLMCSVALLYMCWNTWEDCGGADSLRQHRRALRKRNLPNAHARRLDRARTSKKRSRRGERRSVASRT